jgi:N-sulfoglucosamine sulfohydrolase
MKSPPFLLFLFFLLSFFPAFGKNSGPNFIIIIGDDVGWDTFGCTGMKEARTPAIDKLASESCMMTRFYCSVSQCAPLRAELYTGLLPKNNGVLANAKKEKRPGVKNIADHLIPLGYKVGLSGKKHFGLGTAKIDVIPGFASNANGSNQVHSFDGVEEYVSRAKKNGSSFCVIIGATHAHHPWDHGKESNYPLEKVNLRPHYIDTPAARKAVAKHAAEVEVLDQQVRETRELMEKMDLEKDTILIFLSEQGIAMPRGKWSPYEHGSRALCLAQWKGHILPRETTALAMYCDIVPTLIDFAGGKDPDLDGRSLKGLWTDKQVKSHRKEVLISNVHPFWQKAIVTDTYKLIWTGHPEREHIWGNFTSKGKFFAKPWAEWKEKARTDETAARKVERVIRPNAFELYDVVNDPYEVNDLASLPEHQKRITTLQVKLKKLMTDCGESTTPPGPEEPKKKKGKANKRKPRNPSN